ncbi:MAG: C40 family peptidase [Opitutae bacterium]|jgi:cell wall-associated NlpC family hydrolase
MINQQIIVPVTGLRRAAVTDAPLDNECLWGDTFIISHYKNGFAFGQLEHDGYEGWVDASCLGNLPAPDSRVVAPMSHVTIGPDIKSSGIMTLSIGTRVTCLEGGDETVKIVTSIGHGFMPKRHLKPLYEIADDWVTVAESFIGSPYKWGGRSIFGIDCSGLVQLALAAGGVAVPRDSGPQHAIGNLLGHHGDIQRGDLVFWTGHVGIMLNECDLLHANAYHMAVVCESLKTAIERIDKIAGPVTAIRRVA